MSITNLRIDVEAKSKGHSIDLYLSRLFRISSEMRLINSESCFHGIYPFLFFCSFTGAFLRLMPPLLPDA